MIEIFIAGVLLVTILVSIIVFETDSNDRDGERAQRVTSGG